MADEHRLDVRVVSPEQVLYRDEAEMVVCRTTDGDVAFLPGHAPFIGSLGIAMVRVILAEGPGGAAGTTGEQVVAVHGGFVEVSNDRVIVLSDVAELPERIDVTRAEAARERADAALSANPDDVEAAAAKARAALRLEVAGVRAPG